MSARNSANREDIDSDTYQELFHNSTAIKLIIDPENGKIMEANHAACSFYGYGHDELLGKTIMDINILSPEDTKKEMESAAKEKRRYFLFKHRLADGQIRDVDVYSGPVNFAGKKMLYSIIHDVTDRVSLEEKLNHSLKEKDILLKEIHHRVKNNLQVISSLINLQASYMRDPHDEKLISACQGRITSMSIIHEMLYRTEDLTNIDLSEYINRLRKLVTESYSIPGVIINFQMEIENIMLPLNIALPCSIVINELMTNAFKHAFVNRTEGKIFIRGKKSENLLSLTIRDDGPGFSDPVDLKTPGNLGMVLVYSLVEQLDGRVEYNFNNGAEFQLEIPLA